ncbi:MAG TPA: hypothetical protein VNO34_07415, partial [Actinomycetota bacterium]|nr:hypothetical protein [Actinomycetota bacterium]
RGLGLCLLALAGAGLLALPLALDLAAAGGAGLGHRVPPASFASALRLAPGPGPGTGWLALCLPLAAALSLAFLPPALWPAGARAGLVVVGGVYLSWASAAGLVPEPAANAPVYAGTAAVGSALLAGMGLASLVPGVASAAFGHRQLVAGLLVLAAGVGLSAQAAQALRGDWEVGGPDRVPAAYALVREGAPGGRVLWLGAGDGDAFPPPGGLPDGLVRAGQATVRYAVRWAGGASALDVGRSSEGPGYRALEAVLAEVLSGATRHGGALLAPFGVRFVVADPADLPEPAWIRLLRQVDLDPVPVGGLRVLENAKAVPAASVVVDPGWTVRARGPALGAVDLPLPEARPFQPPRLEGGAGPGAMVLLAQEFDPRWRLELPGGARLRPFRAFGWATAFAGSPVPGGSAVGFGGQRAHALTLGGLAVLWAAVTVITRRPPRRG